MTKYIIFDSGALINLTQNGLLEHLESLEKVFQGEFIITPAVKYESIEHPLQIKKFEWGALRISHLLEDEVVRESGDLIDNHELDIKTHEVMETANNLLFSSGKPIHLIEKGEAECLALCLLLTKDKEETVVVIDERTARMLCEDPEKLRQLMENKLHTSIKLDKEKAKLFRSIRVIRTPELMYMANKRKILGTDKRTLEAVLYALKFGGCSISEKEVQMLKNL